MNASRAKHLMVSVQLKRRLLAEAYREMRRTLPPEGRAAMRRAFNDTRRQRKGYATT